MRSEIVKKEEEKIRKGWFHSNQRKSKECVRYDIMDTTFPPLVLFNIHG